MHIPQSMGAIERLLMIVGCQRSGTTLTGQILGASSDSVLFDEFDGLYPWFYSLMDGEPCDVQSESLIEASASKYGRDDARFILDRSGPRLAPHVKVLVLKAPNLTYDEDLVARAPWPVTVVYPVRDPRAVAASMARLEAVDFVANQNRLLARRPRIAAQDQEAATLMADESASPWTRRAALWRIKTGRQRDFEQAGCRVHGFRYEDLVDDSATVIGAMFAECRLDDPHRGFNAHLNYAGIGPGGTDRTRPIDRASLAGRDDLTTEQQADVMNAAAPLAERLGYV